MFWEYLKVHWKLPLILTFFLAVEALIFALYRLPVQAVLYAAAVCAFFGVAAAVFDYGSFCVKHRKLQQMRKVIEVSTDHLPLPQSLLEKDYQEMVRALFEQNKSSRDEMEAHFKDTVEYYTMWAHQIKTPIAAMRLLLGETDFPEKQELLEELQRIEQYVEMVLCYLRLDGDGSDYVIKEYDLDKILRQVPEKQELLEELQRIEQYVEMVLCYLRLDGDGSDYVIKEYDLDKILRQVIRKHASSFIRKKIRLDYKETGLRIVTDEKWLFFVLDQIFSNALKYTQSGYVSVLAESPKTLCIRDTGIGIAPEDIPRIFERGYTGMAGRCDKRASGIGLYLCRRICMNLGHQITVTSVPGEGTQVKLDLKNAELEVE